MKKYLKNPFFWIILTLLAVGLSGAGRVIPSWIGIKGPAPDSNKVGVGASGQLYTSDFLIEVAKGNVPGHSIMNKFGHNPAVETGPEDLWSSSGVYAFYPTTAQAMEVVSSNDEDGGAGTDTGALTMMVFGHDENWVLQSETVILNGTTVVPLGNTYIRMYRAVVLTVGDNATGTNLGNITIRIASAGVTGAYIAIGDGKTQQAIFSIPADTTAFFLKGYVGMSDGGNVTSRESAEFKWNARTNNGVTGAWTTEGQVQCINDGGTTWQYLYGAPNGPIPEKTDIKLQSPSTSATLGLVGGFDLLLVENAYLN